MGVVRRPHAVPRHRSAGLRPLRARPHERAVVGVRTGVCRRDCTVGRVRPSWRTCRRCRKGRNGGRESRGRTGRHGWRSRLADGERAPREWVRPTTFPPRDSAIGSYHSRNGCQSSTRRQTCALTRAGAMTVAELPITGVPSILVPLPSAPRDHQTRNAQALVDIGSAVLVPDAECDGQRLAKELGSLAVRSGATAPNEPRRT